MQDANVILYPWPEARLIGVMATSDTERDSLKLAPSLSKAMGPPQGMKENVSRGFRNGGLTPFGYENVKIKVGAVDKSKLAPEAREAPIVQRIFRMALEGRGWNEIVKALNTDGLKTRTGKHFSTTTINNILRNEAYTGTLVWHRKNSSFGNASARMPAEVIRISASHPALISRREDFDRVQPLLTERRPAVRHPRTISSQYLLSGLLHCGKCGSAMIGC